MVLAVVVIKVHVVLLGTRKRTRSRRFGALPQRLVDDI